MGVFFFAVASARGPASTRDEELLSTSKVAGTVPAPPVLCEDSALTLNRHTFVSCGFQLLHMS